MQITLSRGVTVHVAADGGNGFPTWIRVSLSQSPASGYDGANRETFNFHTQSPAEIEVLGRMLVAVAKEATATNKTNERRLTRA